MKLNNNVLVTMMSRLFISAFKIFQKMKNANLTPIGSPKGQVLPTREQLLRWGRLSDKNSAYGEASLERSQNSKPCRTAIFAEEMCQMTGSSFLKKLSNLFMRLLIALDRGQRSLKWWKPTTCLPKKIWASTNSTGSTDSLGAQERGFFALLHWL